MQGQRTTAILENQPRLPYVKLQIHPSKVQLSFHQDLSYYQRSNY